MYSWTSLITVPVIWSILCILGWLLLSGMYRDKERPGVFIDPTSWKWVWRPVLCAFGGVTVTLLIWLLFQALTVFGVFSQNFLSPYLCSTIAIGFAIIFGLPERDENGDVLVETVPGTKLGALVTFNGAPLWGAGVFRTSGDYPWRGRRLRLDRYRLNYEGDFQENGITDKDGFVFLGPVQIKIWNNSDEVNKLKLSMIAKNRAEVFGTLTITLWHKFVRTWLDNQQALLQVADSARQAYREIVDMLVDTDVPAVHGFLGPIMTGRPIITAFIPKSVDGHKEGAMIRDDSGSAMSHLVEFKPGETEEDALNREVREFLAQLAERANPKMLKLITKQKQADDGTKTTEIRIKVLKVSKPLHEVVKEVGSELRKTLFGDIDLSEPVKKAGAQASAETDERIAQLASAKTNREARKLLMPTPTELRNKEAFQLATVLQAAADSKNDSIKVVLVPGGNPLAAAAVAGASQIGGNLNV